ncbi:hypothetical protein [Streptomyces sp. NPDC001933]|uniref:hypothetical protein n=1 Tax=Streptomyces sp. NPDC001933 TaxID=3364626 RepID=UPI0036B6235B
MTTMTTRNTAPDVPVANRCLPPGTEGWSCHVWNSGRKIINRVLNQPQGDLARDEQQRAVRAIKALHDQHQDPALLLVALYITAHELRDPLSESLADAVSELAAITEEGALTGFRIRFPAQDQTGFNRSLQHQLVEATVAAR